MRKHVRLAAVACIFLLITLPLLTLAQKAVSGKIVSSVDQSPLPGVTVAIKGSTMGTASNPDGSFVISAKKGDVLVFTGIAVQRQEVTVGDDSFITVELSESSQA